MATAKGNNQTLSPENRRSDSNQSPASTGLHQPIRRNSTNTFVVSEIAMNIPAIDLTIHDFFHS
jgi:hypothetical protein